MKKPRSEETETDLEFARNELCGCLSLDRSKRPHKPREAVRLGP